MKVLSRGVMRTDVGIRMLIGQRKGRKAAQWGEGGCPGAVAMGWPRGRDPAREGPPQNEEKELGVALQCHP